MGRDPRPVEAITAFLHGVIRQVQGGIAQQAIAAIENALVDIKAKALGIPVYELLGGPVRDRIPLYWSHCGYVRTRWPDKVKEWTGKDPIRNRDDIVRHAREVAEAGFKGLKTNPMRFDGPKPYVHMPGFNGSPGHPELNISKDIVDAVVDQMAAFREGAGPQMNLQLDLNFNYKTEGYIRLAQAMEQFDLFWLEMDTYDAVALATIRRSSRTRIASCGSRCFIADSTGRSSSSRRWMWRSSTCRGTAYWPETMKIASLAYTYEVNIAPHNFNGHLGHADECASMRRGAECTGDGDRHRRRALERQRGYLCAKDRRWRPAAADRHRLGCGCKRGSAACPSAQSPQGWRAITRRQGREAWQPLPNRRFGYRLCIQRRARRCRSALRNAQPTEGGFAMILAGQKCH